MKYLRNFNLCLISLLFVGCNYYERNNQSDLITLNQLKQPIKYVSGTQSTITNWGNVNYTVILIDSNNNYQKLSNSDVAKALFFNYFPGDTINILSNITKSKLYQK